MLRCIGSEIRRAVSGFHTISGERTVSDDAKIPYARAKAVVENMVAAHQLTLGSESKDEIEEYLTDIKRMFIEKFRSDPAQRMMNPEKIWNSMKSTIRRDVEKLFEKRAGSILSNK
jgi:hypothetical protein